MIVAETPETGKILSSNDVIRSLIKEGRLNKSGTFETPEDGSITSRNDAIRYLLRSNNLKLWQLADAMGVSEATITRMMRHEVSDEQFAEIVTLIRNKLNSTPEKR